MHGGGAAGQLGELLARPVEADLEALGFASPAFAFGFADAGGQVVADAFQPPPLSWVDAKEWAPDTALTELILVGRWREPCQAEITLSNWALVRSRLARRVGGGIFGQGTGSRGEMPSSWDAAPVDRPIDWRMLGMPRLTVLPRVVGSHMA